MLKHGGKLIQAVNQYNIPLNDWLDLSTGLNPQAWPVRTVSVDAWAQLPDDDDGLVQAARDYYAGKYILPVAGSQAAIQALPKLRDASSRIAILTPAYAEHAHAWQSHGYTVTPVAAEDIDRAVKSHDVVLLVNPNNPTGERFSIKQCLGWHAQLQQRGGCLIIDEAFIDSTPEQSLVKHSHQDGLIVLRSLGKFFGLAGARVGFVFAQPSTLTKLANLLGPWPISGPSRCIARLALHDTQWQQATRQQLEVSGLRLKNLLIEHGLTPDGGTSLFQWLKTSDAEAIHEQLAQQGILTRLFLEPLSIRFGLPATEAQWSRLEQALMSLTQTRIVRKVQQ